MSCEFHPNRLYKLLSNQESLPDLLGQDDRCDSLIPQAVCSLYHPVIKSQLSEMKEIKSLFLPNYWIEFQLSASSSRQAAIETRVQVTQFL